MRKWRIYCIGSWEIDDKNEEKVKEKTRTKDNGGPLFSVYLFTDLSAIFSFGRVQMRKRQQVLFFSRKADLLIN